MFLAALVFIPVALWLTRDSGFYQDNLNYFAESGNLSPEALLEPFSGHLTATTRLIYELNLRLVGPAPWMFQLQMILISAAVPVLLFLLIRRWAGVALALPLSLVLLVLGSTPDNFESYAIVWPLSIASGLAALIAIELESRRGYLVACGLLVISVLSFEIGLMFAAAALVLLTARYNWPTKLWVVMIPVALYGAWWLWAQRFDDPSLASFSNLRRLPTYALDSLASGAAAFVGISAFDGETGAGASLSSLGLALGRLLAGIFLAIVLVAVVRGGRSVRVSGAVVFLTMFVVAGTLTYAPIFREPTAPRYLYPVLIGMILVFAASSSGLRRSRIFWLTIATVFAFAFVVNLSLLRDRGAEKRQIAGEVDAGLAVIELERNLVPAGFRWGISIPNAAAYLQALDRWGRPGYPSGVTNCAAAAVQAGR